jgi:hypothetical protein|tara:strand:+ start:49 stop:171 length:123 start_codon:yes stop_codon:yes gene_type:complete
VSLYNIGFAFTKKKEENQNQQPKKKEGHKTKEVGEDATND